MSYTVAVTAEFENFLDSVRDLHARRAINVRIVRFEAGLFGDVKSLGDKVSEARIDVGPGYRLYFTMRGRTMIVLLCGGDKRRQSADIQRAKALAAGLANRGLTMTDIHEIDTAALFATDEDQVHLIRDALASGDARYIAHAVGVVARARGLSQIGRDTGIKRQTLHKSLSKAGNPTLETLLPVLKALHLRLDVREEKAA